MLTLKQKATWLQKHYGDYSLSWYLANPSRLEVIYEREYTKYLASLQQSIQQQQEEQIREQCSQLEVLYRQMYQSDYNEDFKNDRVGTMLRVRNINFVGQAIV